jgi:hypothetical protein
MIICLAAFSRTRCSGGEKTLSCARAGARGPNAHQAHETEVFP